MHPGIQVGAEDLAAADFDGDGRVDLFVYSDANPYSPWQTSEVQVVEAWRRWQACLEGV